MFQRSYAGLMLLIDMHLTMLFVNSWLFGGANSAHHHSPKGLSWQVNLDRNSSLTIAGQAHKTKFMRYKPGAA